MVDILLGLQWGDEGKGKVVDAISNNYNIVARFQGGPNAGHTLNINGEKYVLNHIPCGIFNKNTSCLIGGGVLVDILTLSKEISSLSNVVKDINNKIILSENSHLILPTHKMIDFFYESNQNRKIGTTLRGIGPCVIDKAGRFGLRVGDVFKKDFNKRLENIIKEHCNLLNIDINSIKESIDEYINSIDLIKNFEVVDCSFFINNAIANGKNILAEGAQGYLLDLDFGDYPYVTSSNTGVGAVCNGLGISHKSIRKVIGVSKGYATRVGLGNFPTECFDKRAEHIQKKGNEFGATTGRKRRCGWLDLPLLKKAVVSNGIDEIVLTKLDVMAELAWIDVCCNYKNNNIFNKNNGYEIKEPLYTAFESWEEGATSENVKMADYIEFIQREIGVKVSHVSLSPDRLLHKINL